MTQWVWMQPGIFPLRFTLPAVVKGFSSPSADNHDVKQRIRFVDPSNEHRFDPQVTLGLACSFALQGIPCVYYGTEQGFTDEARMRRYAKRSGVDQPLIEPIRFYRAIKDIAESVRPNPRFATGGNTSARYQGDGQHFGISGFPGGILHFLGS